MSGAALLGALDAPSRILVAPEALRAPAALARAHPAARATALDADGLAWREHAPDTPRFHAPSAGSARALLIEGARTNLLRNPRFEGAVAGLVGSGGAVPTQMSWGAAAGHALTIHSLGTLQGLPCLDIEFTATAAGSSTLGLEVAAGVALQPNTAYAVSLFAQIVGGSTAGLSVLGLRGRTDAATGVNHAVASLLAVSTTALTRVTGTFTTAADAASGRAQLVFIATGAANIRLRLAAPQMEAGGFATTPVLPPAGAPGAGARGADLVTAPLPALGIGANGACTILLSGTLPQAAGALPQALLQIDDGTAANAIVLLNEAGGTALALRRLLAGAAADSALGVVVAGTRFRLGLALDGAGRAAASLNGAAPAVLTGAPVAGLTTLRLGTNAAADRPAFAEVAALRSRPYALPDPALAAAVAALPA